MTSTKTQYVSSASRKLYLIALILIILLPNVLSGHTLLDGLVSYYPFDNAVGVNDTFDHYDGTTMTDLLHSATHKLGDKSYFWNQATSEMVIDDFSARIKNYNFSFSAWVKMAPSAATRGLMGCDPPFDDSGTCITEFYFNADSDLNVAFGADVAGSNPIIRVRTTNASFEDNVWHLFVVVVTHDIDSDNDIEPNDINIYVDGFHQTLTTLNDADNTQIRNSPPMGSAGRKILFGDDYPSASWEMSGYIDNIGVWNRTLTASEALALWNTGSGLAYPFEAPAIIITFDTPANDSAVTSSGDITINFTHNSPAAQINCTVNNTNFTFNHNTTNAFFYVNNTALTDGWYNIYVECNASDGGSGNNTLSFLLETTNPMIAFTMPSVNNTILNTSNQISVSCTDNNLYEFRGYITNTSLMLNNIFNWTNTSLSTQTDLFSWGLLANAGGPFKIVANCSDGHTDNNIDDLHIEQINSYANRYTYKGSVLDEYYLDSSIPLKELSTTKYADRYSTSLKFSKPDILTWASTSNLFIKRSVSCNTPLIYRDSGLSAHFICGRIWTDSEKTNFKNIVTLKQVTPFYYEIMEYIPKISIDNNYPGIKDDIIIQYKSVGIINTEIRHVNFTYNKHKPTISSISYYITKNYSNISNKFTLSDRELSIKSAGSNQSSFTVTTAGQLSNNTMVLVGNYSLNITIFDIGNLQNGTLFYINVVDQIKPLVNLSIPNSTTFSGPGIFLNYSVSDFSNLANCTIYLNTVLNTTNKTIVEPYNNFTLTLNTTAIHSYYIRCADIYNNIQDSVTRSFIVTPIIGAAATNPYNNTVLDNSNLLNTAALDPDTVSGVLLFGLLFCIFVFTVVIGEVQKIPIFGFMGGILGVVFSFILFARVSAAFGAIMAILGLVVLIRAAFGYE